MRINKAGAFLKYAIIWVFVIIALYPIGYIFNLSLKSNNEFLASPNGLPKLLYLKNYIDAWHMGNIARYGFNTIVYASVTVGLCVLFGSTAAYAIAKLCGKEGAIIYNYFIMGIVLPIQVIMIPLFRLLKEMYLMNNSLGIVILYTAMNLPFAIFIFVGFFKTIPNELVEAARIDGCTYAKSFWKVVFPLCKTSTATIAIFVGMNVWKDFTVPLVFITNPDLKTLSIGLLNFKNMFMTNWPALCAAMLLQTLPMVILFLFMQKSFIKGITAGAVKG